MPLSKRIISLVFCSLVYSGLVHSQQAPPAPTTNPQAPTPRTLVSEYNHSIDIFTTGLRQNWTPDRFAAAFGIVPSLDLAPQPLTACGWQAQLLLRPRTVWDERLPFDVEVKHTLDRCRYERDLISAISEARAKLSTPANSTQF
jgi:hypothetical protein